MMLREYLNRRQVNPENYYRLNVEIGVGEFGMNEWNRLADISTGTRRYLGKAEVQRMNLDAAAKLARIYFAKQRLEGRSNRNESNNNSSLTDVPETFAVELPAEVPYSPQRIAPSRPSYDSGREESLPIRSSHTHSPRSSSDRIHTPPTSSSLHPPPLDNPDRFVVNAPTPSQYRTANGTDAIAITSLDEYPRVQDPTERVEQPSRLEPPPLPPKTPIQDGHRRGPRSSGGYSSGKIGAGNVVLPYPDEDGPPVVDFARKPTYR